MIMPAIGKSEIEPDCMPFTALELKAFITNNMRMSHVYQPVMLRVLLERGGEASVTDIAKALLSYDQSQVEYYELRTKNMVGRVLTQNKVIEPIKDGRRIVGYRLNTESLSSVDQAELLGLCEARLQAYLDKRGSSIWQHRSIADGYVPGSVRYQRVSDLLCNCDLVHAS